MSNGKFSWTLKFLINILSLKFKVWVSNMLWTSNLERLKKWIFLSMIDANFGILKLVTNKLSKER